MARQLSMTSTYQDSLRAVGAWLDVRGYREVRIIEDGGTLVVEASSGTAKVPTPIEVLRFDSERIRRLRNAALNDRGAPRLPPSDERGTDSGQ
jgi:hypothetical protein